MEKGQKIEIRIEDVTTEGQGLGKSSQGLAVFVKDTLPGDQVVVELTKVKKNYAFGRVVEVIKASPHRIEGYCQYKDSCGGCVFADYDYDAQLKLKEKQIKDKLIRIGDLENPKLLPIKGMENPFRYRNKASMAISTGGIITRKGGIVENLGDVSIGFYRTKSHDVVDCYDCLIQSEPAMAAVDAVRRFMEEDNITAYDPKWEKGLMRHVVVKTSFSTGQVMVILVINGKGIPNHEKLVDMIDDAIFNLEPNKDGTVFQLASVVLNVNKHKTSEILGDECITIAGKPTILEEVGDLKFEISPLSFYQVNPIQMKVLYDKAMEYAALKGTETVLDLYCGVGTIGLFAAKEMEKAYALSHGSLDYEKLGKVIGIESVKGAVVDANRNAVINKIVGARYVFGKAEEELPKMLGSEVELSDETENNQEDPNNIKIDHADVMILDPPRAGCDERLLDTVVKIGPDRIVYVSCDPGTLARDIKYLGNNGYEFIEGMPVDMFPWTGHVECVVLLSRVDK
ncbi:MAG: 23S rRNA (uracil(1939)-C(5))-methyltransferase RlmD [Eubacteriales bacterium]|nr:23S rRNA (uracil(1939)-C(5))-methyltransferase RlmD [Eubacteriales bacterium]